MAIVINTAPGTYYSAQGDLIFVVYEATKANDPITYPDYKYVADIYVGVTQVARIKKVPQPDNKRGVFNIGDIVRNYVSANFNPLAGNLKAQELALNEFSIKVTVKFGEEYGFILYSNLTVDSERTYYNHYNGRLTGGSNTILPSYVDLMATSRPFITPLMRTAVNSFVSYFADASGSTSVVFRAYDQSNSNVATLSTSITVTNPKSMQVVNIAPPISGIINDSIKYFTVKIGSTSIIQLNLTCESRYEVYNLHFLNKYGGFESREFTKVSKKSFAVTKSDFGRLPYTIDGSGNVVYFNANHVYNESRSTYASQYTEKLTLNTDILTDAEYVWLSELILSPLVYVEQSGFFFPVTITAKDYQFNKVVNVKLTNLTIDVEYGDNYNAQYR